MKLLMEILIDIFFGMYDGVNYAIGPMVGAALATGALSIGGQLISGLQRRNQFGRQRRHNRAMADLAFQRNKQMAELAWERDLEMWHMQNKYNSPVAQMKRFAQAGLNPNLIYGQGTPGNAQMMPSFQPAQYNAPSQPVDLQALVDPTKALKDAYDIMRSHHATKQEKEQAKQAGIQTFIESELKTDKIKSVRLDNIRQALENYIKGKQKKYWKRGINPSDMIWFRFLAITAGEVAKVTGKNWKTWKKKIKGWFKDLLPDINIDFEQIFDNPFVGSTTKIEN